MTPTKIGRPAKGSPPVPPSARRKGGPTIRVSPDEMAEIDAQRGDLSRSDYLVGLVHAAAVQP